MRSPEFSLDPSSVVWTKYKPRVTLNEMLRAAAALAGPEKIGLHALLKNCPRVIDVEISLNSHEAPLTEVVETSTGQENEGRLEISEAIEAAEANSEPAKKSAPGPAQSATGGGHQDRLDVATLEERDGAIWLVFHEAKHFANKELRAIPSETPPVVRQIERYHHTLDHHAHRLAGDYSEVCRSLVKIDVMRKVAHERDGKAGLAPQLDPLIRRVAEGERPKVDTRPRLVIFGFDEDQKNGAVWKQHLARLQKDLRVYAVGNTKTATEAFKP